MPKQKSNRAACKRFSANKNGLVKRGKQNRRHILTKKTRKRKRNLKKAAYVSKQYERNIKAMM